MIFRQAVTSDKWKDQLKAFRLPLGKVLLRKMQSKQYATSLPGVADGKYVVIQFETSFENKKSAIETVTVVEDKDNKWQVCGYYIK